MKAIRFTLRLVIAVGILSAFTVRGADWPRWRGPDLNGISKETDWSPKALTSEPNILWRARVGTGFASFAVANKRVYTTGNSTNTDTLFCLDAESGREIWKYSYPEPLAAKFFEGGTTATPTVDGDVVYQLSRSGHLAALDAATGVLKWKRDIVKDTGAKPPSWGFSGSPFSFGALLVLNAGKHGVAVNKENGRPVWSSGRDESGYSTPLPFKLKDKHGLALFGSRELVAVDAVSGRRLWSYPWKTEYDVNAADPIFSGDKVFISSGYGKGGALIDLSSAKPKEVWANQNMHTMFNPAVLINGHLFGISGQSGRSGDSGLACVELATGNLKWLEKSLMFGAMTATNDKLIAIGEKGELVIAEASPTQFKAVARANVLFGRCWTAPVLANGLVYVRNAKGDVVCVDLRQ